MNDAVELGSAHAHPLDQLRVALQFTCRKVHFAPSGFLLHALHLHMEGAGWIVGGNFVTIHVVTRNHNFGVGIINLLDDRGKGLIKKGHSKVAALVGEYFQPSS